MLASGQKIFVFSTRFRRNAAHEVRKLEFSVGWVLKVLFKERSENAEEIVEKIVTQVAIFFALAKNAKYPLVRLKFSKQEKFRTIDFLRILLTTKLYNTLAVSI